MERVLFRGVMPAMVTPFTGDRKLMPEAVKRLMDFELSRGVKGFYLNGSTGEGPVLSRSLRMSMTEAAVEANAGRAPAAEPGECGGASDEPVGGASGVALFVFSIECLC